VLKSYFDFQDDPTVLEEVTVRIKIKVKLGLGLGLGA
jgi:hypothetical protein